MEIKKYLMKYGPLVSFILIIGLALSMWILYIPIMRIEPIPGERKAIIAIIVLNVK